jgi:hypothetical protein
MAEKVTGDVEVQYTGIATRCRVTKDQWEAAKVPNQDTVEWNASNQYKVKVSAAAAAVLAREPNRFKVPE